MARKYFLYLDEMLENFNENIDFFCLAGFIVSEDEKNIIDAKMTKMKNSHGITDILHWTELRRFKEIWQTKSESEIKAFMNDFIKLIDESELTILASLYNAKLISNNVKSKKWLSHRHIYCMKKIFENFFIFLNKENSIYGDVEGHIIVESSTIDEELKKLFHSVMIFGTDFISQQGLTKFIKDIEFISKSENNNLLQVADPIPSELHRALTDNDSFSKRLMVYKNEFQNLRSLLISKSFNGHTNRNDLFGIHVLK